MFVMPLPAVDILVLKLRALAEEDVRCLREGVG